MLLNAFATFVRSLAGRFADRGARRISRQRGLRRKTRDQRPEGTVAVRTEELEPRTLLAAPQLVSVAPNTGGTIVNGQIRNENVQELTFTFSAGQTINAATLQNGITVTRSNGDGVFGDGDDIAVAKGYVGIGNASNQVVLRFAETLANDTYRITINGSLQNSLNEAFNDGVAQNVTFQVDYGGQVVSVVPQPIIRDEILNVLNVSNLRDGDTFNLSIGGRGLTFQFKDTGTSSTVPPSNVAISYNSSMSTSAVAQAVADAISGSTLGADFNVSVAASSVTISGIAFTPTIKLNNQIGEALSHTEGALSQKKDVVNVYFSATELNPQLAQDPSFYQLFDSTTGVTYLPLTVDYKLDGNTATLFFGTDLPDGTYQLKIGGSNAGKSVFTTAIQIGTLFSNTGDYSTRGYLGNEGGVADDFNDVDMYQFQVTGPTNVTISTSNLAATLPSGVFLRLFDSVGNFLGMSTSSNVTPWTVGLTGAGTYYLGVSSQGNTAYDPNTGADSFGGTGYGSYNLSVGVDLAASLDAVNTTSFLTANNVGSLGAGGLTIDSVITTPPGSPLYPPPPGGIDEPGHRDIPLGTKETGGSDSGTTPTAGGGITTFFYNFRDNYGTDPQGNTLHNAITESQKARAREVLEMYAYYLGIQVVETASAGVVIATGDLRAVQPSIPTTGSVAGIAGGGKVVMNGFLDWGESEYGGSWFTTAFHEIGHALGLGHSYDIPSIMGGGMAGLEPVFPGDYNLVTAERLYHTDSTDINLYKFQLDTSGTFTAEITAQRMGVTSLLDSSLSLYQEVGGVRTLIARNDDYFGRDAFLNLHLAAGTYYVAVTASGNDDFDPSISYSGYGGRTEGSYSLDLNFTADLSVTETLNTLLGVAFDGDADERPGGDFDFWFQSGDTIIVDKAGFGDFTDIDDALAAAVSGNTTSPSIIRIVGNGGADGDVSTQADNFAYLIGFDSLGDAAEDGSVFETPQGVTVMFDAGAIIKLKSAIIEVGHSTPGIDRSGGAVQVLGTTQAILDANGLVTYQNQVYFTSLANDALGGHSDSTNFSGPKKGEWGGIVYHQGADVQTDDFAGQGIFLSSVNQGHFSYGGGQVSEDSVVQIFTPVTVLNPDPMARTVRPAVWFNDFVDSADAVISADPNSFQEGGGRVGPRVDGNQLSNNSLNGLFIRVQTSAGQDLTRLEVTARLDDTDIVHILTDALEIAGNPGGAFEGAARVAGSLIVDPGMIVKMLGARIEARIGGSQIIAEGTAQHPIFFTSLNDDRYGAGGTFDTNNDGASAGAAGDWGGFFFNSTSTGSIDSALIAFAGGITAIEGGFDRFNAVAIQQADVRIVNSLFENNDQGNGGDRNGRLPSTSSTIFVRGAQPTIVNNVFRNNLGSVITVNANALQGQYLKDRGRSTGRLNAYTQYTDNHGPLVRLNRLLNNQINGMVVRGELVSTEQVWDDTDIVHVLFDEVRDVENLHTYGGVRLQSNSDGSLVVKLAGPNAGFTTDGDPLDVDDRIGGTLQIIGTAQNPVILTSYNDDTVGAGFRPDGLPMFDTANDGFSQGFAGDWRSIRFDKLTNDRNVSVANETELASVPTGTNLNGTSATAQFLGSLASQLPGDSPENPLGGSDDQVLGMEVHGSLKSAGDVDVYSFNAQGQTEIWLDIARTSFGLDTVIELIDALGNVIARSDNSGANNGAGDQVNVSGTVNVNPQSLIKNAYLGGDFYTTNPYDAGMRLTLNGMAGVTSTYFVRVRSANALTQGNYQLQIRLRQTYEHPGSTVAYADIRYATNGIEIYGLPNHSPLVGEAAEYGNNNSMAGANSLGNLLTTDGNTISVAGTLSTSTQVDWYSFTLNYEQIQAIAGVNGGAKTWATMFDIDWADGLGRPDTVISVFDSTGRLIMIARDSNVEDDQPAAGQGNDLDDLTRGSTGKLDPYIGTVQMPTGTPGSPITYYVAVSSNSQLPSAIGATFQSGSSQLTARMEPINSVRRIVEDHIGNGTEFDLGNGSRQSIGYYDRAGNLIAPTTPTIFGNVTNRTQLDTHVTPFTFADVQLFVSSSGDIRTVNPFSGATLVDTSYPSSGWNDIVIRSDGRMFALRNNGANGGLFVELDGGGAILLQNGTGLVPNSATPANDPVQNLTSNDIDAMAFLDNGIGTYSHLWYAIRSGGGSELYRADPNSGVIGGLGTAGLMGAFTGITGRVTGLAYGPGGNLYGVTDTGDFFRVNNPTGGGASTLIANLGLSFSGLTLGPQNVENGTYRNMLFATTSGGQLVALNTSGVLQSVFNNGTSPTMNVGGATGLTFSPIDFNLWHPTEHRGGNAGHGVNNAFDNSRFAVTGGTSFWFGLEDESNGSTDRYLTVGPFGGQYGVLDRSYQEDLTARAHIGNNYNVPGGAWGSLTTSSFNLADTVYTDKPTLYFNYFLDTSNTNALNTDMRDSARVYISSDGGLTWEMLATNNSVQTTDSELPTFQSTSSAITGSDKQKIQLLHDNSGAWRQARIDLGDYAGMTDLRLRFDFSTAGSSSRNGVDEDLPGDEFGDLRHRTRSSDNNHEGFYIDDIIIGYAERGEMVTGANSGVTDFFTVPQNPSPTAPTQQLTGAYQLEIRRGSEYAANVNDLDPDIGINRQFNTNDRLIPANPNGLSGIPLGDRNTFRDQGQLQITSSTIRNSANVGILVDAGDRNPGTNLPNPGSVRNTPVLNSTRQVPGVNINNNIVAFFGAAGIRFEGDSLTNNVAAAPISFGRITNNTVYGGTTPTGIGIDVRNNASPTILNNIVSNTQTGISVDATSTTTVVGTTLFKGNSANGTVGTNSITLTAAQALFVNPALFNFYLMAGSRAIDSSLNSLIDRTSMTSVKSPLGLLPAPIIAPSTDRYGQLRVDDSSAAPPPGLGSNIFKDRGAVERADFSRPTLRLVGPLDNDPADGDASVGVYRVTVPLPLSQIVVQLDDAGIGIDNSTVGSSKFELRENGTPLTAGIDYTFSYNSNTKRVTFTAITTFKTEATYTVTTDTSAATGIKDLAGNVLLPNQPTNTSVLTLIGNAAPFLSSVNTILGLKNKNTVITYAQLLAASDAATVNGHPLRFRIMSVPQGTLLINSGAVTPGTTLVGPGDVLTWTPPAGVTGVTAAFTIIAVDLQNQIDAPALAESSPPVTVRVNLVDQPPTLTTVATLNGGVEDTTYAISYAALQAAANEADANDDTPISFRIEAVSSGTLFISDNGAAQTAVVPGTTVFGPGDTLFWTPPANANNFTNGGLPLNAFTISATDGNSFSSPAVQVRVNVGEQADPPTLTSISTLSKAGINSQFFISFASLAAASNAMNPEGHPVEFRVDSLSSGSLLFLESGSSTPVAVTFGTTVVNAGDALIWTPPNGVTGASVAAFGVKAYDSTTGLASATTVGVTVEVISTPAPTLTMISTVDRARNQPVNVTFADLVNTGNETSPNAFSYRIEAVSSGTLQIRINGGSPTAVTPGVTLVGPNDILVWTPAGGANGTTPAFTVRVRDNVTGLTSVLPTQVGFNLINFAPTLSTVTTFPGGLQETPYAITYSDLISSANEFDANGDPLNFRITGVNQGSLSITRNNATTPVVPGVTIVMAGDTLIWTPPAGVTGNAVPAFTIAATDGTLDSSPVQVHVALSAAYIAGPWVFNGQLTDIQQNGDTITFTNENGGVAGGKFLSPSQVEVTGWGLTATIDTTTADSGRLIFSNNSIWLRLSLGGQWAIGSQLTSVQQIGATRNLIFTNENGGASTGMIVSATRVVATQWGNLMGTITGNGTIAWDNGSQWRKLDLSPDYTNAANGSATMIKQAGTALTFINENGIQQAAKWLNPSTVQIISSGVTGLVSNGRIQFSDGTVWNKNLTVYGSISVNGVLKTVTIKATNLGVFATNEQTPASTTLLRITGKDQMFASSWGIIANRVNGRIQYSNNTAWGNFDFNALNAVFSDVNSFPFP